MRERRRNLWGYWKKPSTVVVVTTNGYVKKNGEAVMGRGCAYEATLRIPRIAKWLGKRIQHHGNKVYWFHKSQLITFPVKHNWWEKADLKLIAKSAKQLRGIIKANPRLRFILPRPGCANGKLDWSDVKKVLEPILSEVSDQYLVVRK